LAARRRMADPVAHEAHLKSERNSRRCRHYGITTGDYERLIQEQGGRCPICGFELADGSQIDIDHCHETGVVRGVIHGRCNRTLGHCRESIHVLKGAIAYLEKFFQSQSGFRDVYPLPRRADCDAMRHVNEQIADMIAAGDIALPDGFMEGSR
jgi:hypothetical protein